MPINRYIGTSTVSGDQGPCTLGPYLRTSNIKNIKITALGAHGPMHAWVHDHTHERNKVTYCKLGNVRGYIIFVGTLVPRKLNT